MEAPDDGQDDSYVVFERFDRAQISGKPKFDRFRTRKRKRASNLD
jgi:hypothetical protein